MIDRLLSKGLYAITDADRIPDDGLVDAVKQAILGGARIIQYRDKSTDHNRRLAQAQVLNELCQSYGIPLMINDDVELTAEVGAAGVHIGKDDPSLSTTRRRLGEKFIIGVSCYNRLDLALDAARGGADYVAFGSFFPSLTKSTGMHASLALLAEARKILDLTLVAIGGITPSNGKALVEAGADYLAVVSGIFGQPDIQAAARAYAQLFKP
jgi:thiamine-phosphate pyrophosphorylase